MPKRKQTGNLEDLSRQRRWQLLKKSSEREAASEEEGMSGDNMGVQENHPQEEGILSVQPQSHAAESSDEENTQDEQGQSAEVAENVVCDDDEQLEVLYEDFAFDGSSSENELQETEALLSEHESSLEEDDDVPPQQDYVHEQNEAPQAQVGDQALYDGAPLTLVESMIAILTLSITHSISGACLADILHLIYLHCKKPTVFRDTLYKFRKFFLHMKSPIVRHFFCSQCLMYLQDQHVPCSCQDLDQRIVSYFIEIPIVNQLKNLFSREGFYENLQHRFKRRDEPGVIHDVYDAYLYQKLFKPGKFLWEKNNISFTWYSDGIPLFKSRKFSLWPIYLSVNELPYIQRVRQENVIVAGLWFGPSDPIVNLFMQPLYKEMKMLSTTGVDVRPFGLDEKINVKAVVLYGTADTPARSDFLCHVRFNGDYGCTVCKAKGYNISGQGYGNTHVYPFEGMEDLRSQKETDLYARQALETGKSVYGVKGATVLSKIMPNSVKGVSIDVMHSVCLGVVKKLMLIWFDSKLRMEKFSLYAYLSIIDDRIANLRPPSSVQRLPRSISQHLAFFKASEFKAWFFYYSLPILSDVMREKYLKHYTKLVMALYLLCAEKISQDMLSMAEKLLIAFVSQFQKLYDARFMSINIHLLLHLPETVRNTGPLWASSCFPFEDLNGKLVKTVHGTTHPGLQVYSSVAHSVALPYVASQLPDSDVKSFSLKLLDYQKKLKLTEIGRRTYIVGGVSRCQIIPNEVRLALERAGIRYDKVSLFHRLRKGKQLFSSVGYSRCLSHVDHFILFEDDVEVKKVGIVQVFVQICECQSEECNNECSPNHFAIVKEGDITPYFTTSASMTLKDPETVFLPYVYIYKEGKEPSLVPVHKLKSTCFLTKVNEQLFVSEPVNLLDTE